MIEKFPSDGNQMKEGLIEKIKDKLPALGLIALGMAVQQGSDFIHYLHRVHDPNSPEKIADQVKSRIGEVQEKFHVTAEGGLALFQIEKEQQTIENALQDLFLDRRLTHQEVEKMGGALKIFFDEQRNQVLLEFKQNAE